MFPSLMNLAVKTKIFFELFFDDAPTDFFDISFSVKIVFVRILLQIFFYFHIFPFGMLRCPWE